MSVTNVSINRQVGSILVVIGTEVGAGILALPILIAHMGFPLGCLVMFIVWALMTYTALLVCEANLACEDGVSFAGMANSLLGTTGQVVVWVSFMLLLYMIMTAYISAAQSAFDSILHVGAGVVSLLFVVILGSTVMMGTGMVDLVNRVLLGLKLLLLLFVCFILLPNVHAAQLLPTFFNTKILIVAVPVFVTSFVSHLVIPSLRTYLHSNAKVMARVILIGSAIPLILYLIWVIGILGVIPYFGANSFATLFATTNAHDANVGDILNLMKVNLNNSLFYAPVLLFSNISVTTSFLGVSLALYHFVLDGFKLKRLPVLQKNIVGLFLTFVIPLLIVWFLPNVFLKALGYVGLCCSVLLVIIPVFMIRRLKQQGHQFKIYATNNNTLLNIALIMGILVVLIQLFV
jgi:tyrosine-specific transport protein